MEPPPPAVSVLTSLMCVCLSVWTYASNGRSTAALAVLSFALLSLQLLTVPKLKFSQLASSVFGLFYCGEQPSQQAEDDVQLTQTLQALCACNRSMPAHWQYPPILRCLSLSFTSLKDDFCRLSAQLLDQAACPVRARSQQLCGSRLAGARWLLMPC